MSDFRSGDAAEQKFKEYAKAKGMSVERYGFDRTEMRNFHRLPHFVRATPDFVAATRSKGFLVECKAGGQGDTINIKHTDFPIFVAWQQVGDLFLFFNDSKRQCIAFVHSVTFIETLERHQDTLQSAVWSNGVSHVKIPKLLLKWENYRDF